MTESDFKLSGKHVFIFDDGEAFAIARSEIVGLKLRLSETLRARIATGLWVEAVALDARYGIDLQSILQPIFDLEDGGNASSTKPATPFRNEPLRGLWHKHFFSGRFLAANIKASLGKNGVKQIIIDVLGVPDCSKKISKEHVQEIARRIANEPFLARYSSGMATGEWIIYLPRPEGNYYLGLATHDTPDQTIFERILAGGSVDFPDLPQWLVEAKASAQAATT